MRRVLSSRAIRLRAAGAVYRHRQDQLRRRASLPLLRAAIDGETALSEEEVAHGIARGLIRANVIEDIHDQRRGAAPMRGARLDAPGWREWQGLADGRPSGHREEARPGRSEEDPR